MGWSLIVTVTIDWFYDCDSIVDWFMIETVQLAGLLLLQYHWLVYNCDSTVDWSMIVAVPLAGVLLAGL